MTEFLQITAGGLLVGSAYALVALGLYLVYRVTGVVNLAQGAFCVLGALVAWTLQVALGWPAAAALVLGVAAAALVGFLLGAGAFVPGLSRLSNGSMLTLSAGGFRLREGVFLVLGGPQRSALPPFGSREPYDLGGVDIPSQGFWVVGCVAAVAAGLFLVLTRT